MPNALIYQLPYPPNYKVTVKSFDAITAEKDKMMIPNLKFFIIVTKIVKVPNPARRYKPLPPSTHDNIVLTNLPLL